MAVVSAAHQYGHHPHDNPGQDEDFESLVLSCNNDGMDALRKGQHKAAFEQFKYAESILIANQADGDSTSLLAVTCNNLGCYYKKVGKLHGALSYLRRALKIETELRTDEVTLAGTHLNICAILSKLEKHDKAVQHALGALELINRRVDGAEAEKVSQDDYSVLAIAYHNVAVEYDFLRQYDKAADAFRQGHQVAKRCLGEDHSLSIALGKNCEAVLSKSQKLTKGRASSEGRRMAPKDGFENAMPPALPALKGALPTPRSREVEVTQMEAAPRGIPTPRSIREEAASWASNEQNAWSNFASKTLSGDPMRPQLQASPRQPQSPRPPTLPRPLAHDLATAPLRDLSMSGSFSRLGASAEMTQLGASGGPLFASAKTLQRTPLVQALDNAPDALADIIDADRTGHAPGIAGRTAPNDYRPNRMIQGATRTARIVRRTGLSNTTHHRDQVVAERKAAMTKPEPSAFMQKCAAEKIQRHWRAWYSYCQENSDWMTATWISATMIQSKWRSYHVRRVKLNTAANHVQRHVRGHLVRRMLRKHNAAITIQRHVIGMLTRNQLTHMHRSALKICALGRGFLGRCRARARRHILTKTAITLQCAVRCFIAKKRVAERRARTQEYFLAVHSVTTIQRHFRGLHGRRRFHAHHRQYLADLAQHNAATRLQALARRDLAQRRVTEIRAARLENMHRAAVFMQRVWHGFHARRRHRQLLAEYKRHERHIVTLQRFGRGFLVRLRMWREAIRAEEALWAALEVQRVWRGYCGRVRWESALEYVWRREMAAAILQRNLRGWLARARVGRTRRKIARVEFERARRRFRATQRIQALVRSRQSRIVTHARRDQVRLAAKCVQRRWRGYILRKRLWNQVVELRTTMIQAQVRGFLVRSRRFRVLASVIMIQRVWRRHIGRPEGTRNAALAEMRLRRDKAKKIQRRYRKHQETREIGRIQAQERAG